MLRWLTTILHSLWGGAGHVLLGRTSHPASGILRLPVALSIAHGWVLRLTGESTRTCCGGISLRALGRVSHASRWVWVAVWLCVRLCFHVRISIATSRGRMVWGAEKIAEIPGTTAAAALLPIPGRGVRRNGRSGRHVRLR